MFPGIKAPPNERQWVMPHDFTVRPVDSNVSASSFSFEAAFDMTKDRAEEMSLSQYWADGQLVLPASDVFAGILEAFSFANDKDRETFQGAVCDALQDAMRNPGWFVTPVA